jgi:hypothetical protein
MYSKQYLSGQQTVVGYSKKQYMHGVTQALQEHSETADVNSESCHI